VRQSERLGDWRRWRKGRRVTARSVAPAQAVAVDGKEVELQTVEEEARRRTAEEVVGPQRVRGRDPRRGTVEGAADQVTASKKVLIIYYSSLLS